MFEIIDGKVFCKGIKIASKPFILEAEELDLELVFETWFDEVEDEMSQDEVDAFECITERNWAPSIFREALVNYAKEA